MNDVAVYLNGTTKAPPTEAQAAAAEERLRKAEQRAAAAWAKTTDHPAENWLVLSDLDSSSGQADWLVDSLFTSRGIVLVYGAPGSFKSFVALELNLAIATGLAFAGRETRRGHVFITGSEWDEDLLLRTGAWGEEHDVPLDDNAFHWCDCDLNLSDDATVEALINGIKAQAAQALVEELEDNPFSEARVSDFYPKLLTVDTLGRALSGADENSAGAMSGWLKGARRITRTFDCALLIVHHGTDRPRGSSALVGAVSTIIRVERRDNLVHLIFEKQRSGPKPSPITFEAKQVALTADSSSLVLVHVPDAPINSDGAAPAPSGNVARMLDALTEPLTVAAWLTRSGVARRTFYRIKSELLANGNVLERDGVFYRLVPVPVPVPFTVPPVSAMSSASATPPLREGGGTLAHGTSGADAVGIGHNGIGKDPASSDDR